MFAAGLSAALEHIFSFSRAMASHRLTKSWQGYRIYIITVRRMISGELLKWWKGFFIGRGYGRALSASSQFGLTMPSDCLILFHTLLDLIGFGEFSFERADFHVYVGEDGRDGCLLG